MGVVIDFLRRVAEKISKESKLNLYIGGTIITFIVLLLSGISGWYIERIFLFFQNKTPIISTFLFAFILSSALAAKSLRKSIFEIIDIIQRRDSEDSLQQAKNKLSFIVGRDVANLNKDEILRAIAETASENSVDGIFAPLFWMFVGIFFWEYNQSMPGPLSMAWIFKASSTIDSMLGYKQGKLRWLGYTGAKLDDLLTWIPSRIVLITLPFCCIQKKSLSNTIKNAWHDGLVDSSPNSGISEAIFAYCAEVRMGGTNFYNGQKKIKPIIAMSYPIANIKSIKRILNLSMRLQIVWLIGMFMTIKLIS
tara:strand:- start:4844 stop:5767 length:924 start_codon:yes stop_codon:yes gene_type:complete